MQQIKDDKQKTEWWLCFVQKRNMEELYVIVQDNVAQSYTSKIYFYELAHSTTFDIIL
jgi:hypothetical protein